MKALVSIAITALFVGACSSSVSLGEYAEEAVSLVSTMNDRIDWGEAEVAADPTLERAQSYATDRLDARYEFLEDLAAFDPPDEVADLHAMALDIITRLATAETAPVELVMVADTYEKAKDVWVTPEGEEFRRIDEEAVAFCAVVQADLDATQQREVFVDTSWFPLR